MATAWQAFSPETTYNPSSPCSPRSRVQTRCLRPFTKFQRSLRTRTVVSGIAGKQQNFQVLEEACREYRRAPPSERQEYSVDILKALEGLKETGAVKKWGSGELPERVNVFQGELKRVGVINTGAIATPTVRNERGGWSTLAPQKLLQSNLHQVGQLQDCSSVQHS